jgi:hypothetical protein
MRFCPLICAVLFAASLAAAERMTVSVCIRGDLDEKTIVRAEETAAALFQSIDIETVWAKCAIGLEGDEAIRQHWFTLRLRDGRPFIPPAPLALDALGEAFLSEDNVGYIAEVYYQAVETLAATQSAELPQLLGYVIAHELGHLLLGPGHTPKGVMRAAWDRRVLLEIRQGGFKFSSAEGARMRGVWQGTAPSGGDAR